MAVDDDAAGPQGARPPKFIYECVRCGHSCADRNYVELTLRDLQRWTMDQTLAAVFHHIRLAPLGNPFLDLVLASEEGLDAAREGDREWKGCPMHDRENRLCNIYATMPLACRAFPLAYDGEAFFIRDPGCKGLGQGEMTVERLKAHRDAAREELDARRETMMLMPALQGVFTRFFVDESNRALERMSEEDRKRIEEIVSKPPRDAGAGAGDGTGTGSPPGA